jgi:hypothetical protein
MKEILYLVILQVSPKDTVDNSYQYKTIADTKMEYTMFTTVHKNVGDTIYFHKNKKSN